MFIHDAINTCSSNYKPEQIRTNSIELHLPARLHALQHALPLPPYSRHRTGYFFTSFLQLVTVFSFPLGNETVTGNSLETVLLQPLSTIKKRSVIIDWYMIHKHIGTVLNLTEIKFNF